MPQVVALLLLVAVAVVAQRVIVGALRTRSSDQTYRPRGRAWKASEPPATTVLMSRDQLVGLRDAFTSAPIDTAVPLSRCCSCQSVYHDTSLATLARENGGRCVTCDGRQFEPVLVTD